MRIPQSERLGMLYSSKTVYPGSCNQLEGGIQLAGPYEQRGDTHIIVTRYDLFDALRPMIGLKQVPISASRSLDNHPCHLILSTGIPKRYSIPWGIY